MTDSTTLAIAHQAFDAWKMGLATGQWDEFLAMLTEDFTLSFPVGKYQGVHQGKAIAEEFFNFVSQVYAEGLQVTLKRTHCVGNTVIFELKSDGTMFGQTYHNQAAVFFDVRDDKISGYREYLAIFYRMNS